MANMLYDFAERPQSARSHSSNPSGNSRSKFADNTLFDVWTLTKQDVRYYNEPRSPMSLYSPRVESRDARARASSERPYPSSPASTNRTWEPVLGASGRRSTGTHGSPTVLSPQVASNSLSSMKQMFYSDSISVESPTAKGRSVLLGDSEKVHRAPKVASRSLDPGRRASQSEMPHGRHLGRNTVDGYSNLYNESAAGTTLPGARMPPSPRPMLPTQMSHGLCSQPPIDVKATCRYYEPADAASQRASSQDPSRLPASHQHSGKTTFFGTEPKTDTPRDWGKLGSTGTPSQSSREQCRYEVDPSTPGSPGLKPGHNFTNRYADNVVGTLLPGSGPATPAASPVTGTRAPPSTPANAADAAGTPSSWGVSLQPLASTREAMRFHSSPTGGSSPRKVIHQPSPGQPRSYVQRRAEVEASMLWGDLTSPTSSAGHAPSAAGYSGPSKNGSAFVAPSCASPANKEACRFGSGHTTRGAHAAERPRSVSATPPPSPRTPASPVIAIGHPSQLTPRQKNPGVTPKITGEFA